MIIFSSLGFNLVKTAAIENMDSTDESWRVCQIITITLEVGEKANLPADVFEKVRQDSPDCALIKLGCSEPRNH